jgi:hypothetical protein
MTRTGHSKFGFLRMTLAACERTIFVTGSLIPQRVKLEPIGTTTVSPVRIIDRREIDQTGRRTTPGVLINEPSLRVIGH